MNAIVKEPVIQAMPNNMKEDGVYSSAYTMNAPSGATRENILDPIFWAHVASTLRRNDIVHIRANDDTFWAQYLIRDCGRTWAKAFEMHWFGFKGSEMEAEDVLEYECKWNGPSDKFIVLRLADGTKLAKDLSTKDDALGWLAQYKKKQLAA